MERKVVLYYFKGEAMTELDRHAITDLRTQGHDVVACSDQSHFDGHYDVVAGAVPDAHKEDLPVTEIEPVEPEPVIHATVAEPATAPVFTAPATTVPVEEVQS